jgi:hypothetical protein
MPQPTTIVKSSNYIKVSLNSGINRRGNVLSKSQKIMQTHKKTVIILADCNTEQVEQVYQES